MFRKMVNSSNLKSVGYENSTLEIEFNSGGIYQYLNVPGTIYSSLMSAPSKGRYLEEYIKPNYQSRKIN